MTKRVSLKDIAQKVGVSTALVSYVLNNQKEGKIGKAVAQKIRDTARELNYRTNQIAKSLKTNKSLTIGLIVADISNPFSSSMARIIEDEADRHNYTVIFGSSDENVQKSGKLIDTLVNRHVDGLIIAPAEDSETQISYLQEQEIPFVLIDRYFPSIQANHVALDNFKAAYTATSHLLDKGYKRIGMITHATSLFHLLERRNGYLTALKEGVGGDRLREVDMKNAQTEIELALHELLTLEDPIDALLLGSNTIAAIAVKHIQQLGVPVPKDLAIISFDETESLDLFYAPITYLRQPLKEMGRMATQILLENIEKKEKGDGGVTRVNFEAELIIRAST